MEELRETLGVPGYKGKAPMGSGKPGSSSAHASSRAHAPVHSGDYDTRLTRVEVTQEYLVHEMLRMKEEIGTNSKNIADLNSRMDILNGAQERTNEDLKKIQEKQKEQEYRGRPWDMRRSRYGGSLMDLPTECLVTLYEQAKYNEYSEMLECLGLRRPGISGCARIPGFPGFLAGSCELAYKKTVGTVDKKSS